MKNEGALKAFWRTTYQSGSPVPFIISAQVAVFILIHLLDLLYELQATSLPLYPWSVGVLSLPARFSAFIQQPWSLLSYPLLHQGLFQLLFGCLWLYWSGNIFLNLLHRRQFLTLYVSAILLGGLVYLALGQIPYLYQSPQTSLLTGAVPNAALITSLVILVPHSEIRLFLLGTIRLRTLAILYLALQLVFFAMVDKMAAGAQVAGMAWGAFFMVALKQGNDLSTWFRIRRKGRLKVVHNRTQGPRYKSYRSDLPNQEVIDEILDKISSHGYDSLTSLEKEILFKASKQEK